MASTLLWALWPVKGQYPCVVSKGVSKARLLWIPITPFCVSPRVCERPASDSLWTTVSRASAPVWVSGSVRSQHPCVGHTSTPLWVPGSLKGQHTCVGLQVREETAPLCGSASRTSIPLWVPGSLKDQHTCVGPRVCEGPAPLCGSQGL